MTTATRDLGAKDFDYPQIDLQNYSKEFDKVKIIGDEENPANEGKEVGLMCQCIDWQRRGGGMTER